MNGTLYVVATPIGNLEDITHRAVRILSEVNGIAAEDTRHTMKLLNHLNIRTPLLSLHEHNEKERVEQLFEKLEKGENWALVSDAGTPGICDPGALLVLTLRQKGIRCVPVAGPSALTCALSVGGLPESRFHFEGFLPSAGSIRRARIKTLSTLCDPILLYESPHRFKRTLQDLLDVLGDRKLTVFRELTKLHEEVYDTSLSGALQKADSVRGEYILLIGEAEPEPQLADDAIEAHLLLLLRQGLAKKEAVSRTVEELRVRKNRVYTISLGL